MDRRERRPRGSDPAGETSEKEPLKVSGLGHVRGGAWGGAVALLAGEAGHPVQFEAAYAPSLLSPAPMAAPPPALRLFLCPPALLALSPPLAHTPALLTCPAPTRLLILTCCVLPLTPACPLPARCSPTPAGRLLRPGPAGLRSGWWTLWGTPGLSLSTPGSSLHARYVPSGFCVRVGPPPRAAACLPALLSLHASCRAAPAQWREAQVGGGAGGTLGHRSLEVTG